jgi:hypothetical protein
VGMYPESITKYSGAVISATLLIMDWLFHRFDKDFLGPLAYGRSVADGWCSIPNEKTKLT